MKQFVGGFVSASVLWVGILYAQSAGTFNLFGSDPEEQLEEADTQVQPLAEKTRPPRKPSRRWKRGRRKNNQSQGGGYYDTSEGVAGDSLGSPGSRELAMGSGGAEDQLLPAEIDKGIDGVFNGIQRCLILVPSQAPATGKVIFGMHIASSGRVTNVNLKGPNVIIGSEAGACMIRTAKSIKYRSFDGPDMIVHYPIVFD